jgi:hypothetical protein
MRALTTGIVCLTLFAAACGAPSRGDDDDDNPPPGDGNQQNPDGCSDEAKLIYVVDVNNQLSTYDPTTRQFSDKGLLSCPAMQGATPFSMGIDRNAGAYVLFNSGELFKVDTATLACQATAWQPGGPSGLLQVFGMGFSTDAAGGTTDKLYIAGGFGPSLETTSRLNTLDVGTMAPTQVGTVQEWPELTGTGDAELWGFFPSETSPRIQKLDKTNGSALQTFNLGTLTGLPMSWAFAFFGGNFHVFLQRDTETSTSVYEVNGQTGAISNTLPTGTRSIVGAGVSTCAPTVIL